jgi:hypothetical protein
MAMLSALVRIVAWVDDRKPATDLVFVGHGFRCSTQPNLTIRYGDTTALVCEQDPKPLRFAPLPERDNRYSPLALVRKTWRDPADLKGHCDGTAPAGRGWQ